MAFKPPPPAGPALPADVLDALKKVKAGKVIARAMKDQLKALGLATQKTGGFVLTLDGELRLTYAK